MIGIIQGRLSQPINNKIQAFPWSSWEEEFSIAAEIGFDDIEFIFETENYLQNPLWTTGGLKRIKELTKETGVMLNHICADYFMENPFVRVSREQKENNLQVLKKLMEQVMNLGVKSIELPMVDNSRIENEAEKNQVVEILQTAVPLMEKYNLGLSIESSLPPQELKDLLERLAHPLFSITYDTGNSSSLGYDTEEEILAFGKWISNVHIKDRVLHGTTVALGTGDADLSKSFEIFKQIGYSGPFTLQAARAEDPVENSRNQYQYLQNLISQYLKK